MYKTFAFFPPMLKFVFHNHSCTVRGDTLRSPGAMFQLIPSWASSLSQIKPASWQLNHARRQSNLIYCHQAHPSFLSLLSLLAIISASPTNNNSRSAVSPQARCSQSAQPPVQATQLFVFTHPFALFARFPRLARQPGRSLGMRKQSGVSWVLHSCGIAGRYYGMLLMQTDVCATCAQ